MEVQNAVLAVALGSVAAVVLLLPVAFVQYRRNGRLGPADLAVLLAAAVYGLSLWTYTLLPTPDQGDYACLGSQLDLLGSIGRIGRPGDDGVLATLRSPAFLQVALNVLLFVPLGYFVRRVLRRGVVVATVLGLGVSLLIECTQLTGVWGVYDCPYRLFDVDDLLVNTLGAVLGSVASLPFVDRDGVRRPRPAHVTSGRRLMGMACDLLFVVLAGAVVALVFRAYEFYVAGERFADRPTQTAIQWLVPLVVESAAVLLTGRTVGEAVVAVRAVARRPALAPLSRVVKLVAGVGGFFALALVQAWWGFVVLAAFAVLTVVAALRSTEHRGLSHVLAGMDLETTNSQP